MDHSILVPEKKYPPDLFAHNTEIRRKNFTVYRVSKEEYENIWDQLQKITVADALKQWLSSLPKLTGINYGAAFNRLESLELVTLNLNLRQFSLINNEAVIDRIKSHRPWSEATRQARAAAYISFTGFLERQTKGVIKKTVISVGGVNKTFPRVREKGKTRALSKNQTRRFLKELDKINSLTGLIAKVTLQGGKRIEEVLSLQIENIDFLKKQISFIQSKTRGMEKITIIHYPAHIMRQLRHHIGKRRSGLAFINKTGKKIGDRVYGKTIYARFIKAGKNSAIPFRVTPHVLRTTLVTRLKELNIPDTDIMKVTGHSSIKEILKYDKTLMAENPTLHHNFV